MRLAPSSEMDSGKTTEWITKTTTHVRRFRRRGELRRCTSADDGGAIRPTQNGHVLFWITWTHLQWPARSFDDKQQPLALAVAESFRGILRSERMYEDVCEAESSRNDRAFNWWNTIIFTDKDLYTSNVNAANFLVGADLARLENFSPSLSLLSLSLAAPCFER